MGSTFTDALKYHILGMPDCNVGCFGSMAQVADPLFTLREPSRAALDAFLLRAQDQSFSYSETGSTQGKIPTGYTVDHNRITLGSGADAFRRAVSAIRAWEMFNMGWTH